MPLVPEVLAWRGRAVRIVGGGCLPLHALTLPRPVLRLAEFFQGGGEGWGWVWGLGLRAFLSPVFGECAVWVLRDIMFLTGV